MPAVPARLINGKPADLPKSWKKINEERKALRKQRKQEKQIKLLEKAEETKLTEEQEKLAGAKNPITTKENPSTISIAVPGSILENAQSAELRTYVAGQIARAACIFRVHEVIVFDDVGIATARETKRLDDDDDTDGPGKTVRSSSLQLGRILQYLECPQYLRKFFFPLHKDLQYSGLLNPLDTPHHLRQQSSFLYREGIISDKKAKEDHSYVNVGLLNDVLVNKAIEPGMRVTVKLQNPKDMTKKLRGTVVSPDEPRRVTGVYWGYQVRIAHTLSDIFTKCPYPGGYDLSIGTSDRGQSVHDVEHKSLNFNHMLIVFGGLKGLEAALVNDEKLNVDDPALLFDHYLNVFPRQGSRTIRTEEALLIALAALQEKLQPKVAEVEQDFSEFLPRSEDTSDAFNAQPQFPRKQKKRKEPTQSQSVEENVTEEELPVKKHKQQLEDINIETHDEIQKTVGFKSPDKFKKNPFDRSKQNKQSLNENHTAESSRNDKGESYKSPKKLKNTKNPFGSTTEKSETQQDVDPPVEDDFEVVPSTHHLKSEQKINTDMSRFD